MNKNSIQHIFFDLDHTLWDFERNSDETLISLFEKYKIGEQGVNIEDFLAAYKKINHQLWDLYNHSKVTKEDIRLKRFPMAYEEIGLDPTTCPDRIGDEYLEICPHKPYLIEGCVELLEGLKGKYTLHILSNGFDKTQSIKLSTTGLNKYFDVVVTSESCGAKKPSPEIYTYALEKAGANVDNSIMIGDNPITDIKGAKDFGLQTIYFGQENTVADIEVKSLIEILEYL
ncbi:YjjG family noncanonical pyrimidine nucleotidase [Flammeovirga sp. SubArs3]|uniref:YjjG family noncanonical pyrimidine nucleotidase n=1 Tax=Flammeovirga sp. SubArs3 TaxID=2995316 RepID=UPI00248CC68F|nr:YjjG family noncanonical pyrimidine nucleotidase [Flammeovirga sp. SubArs3]